MQSEVLLKRSNASWSLSVSRFSTLSRWATFRRYRVVLVSKSFVQGYFRTDFLTSDGARSVTKGSISDYDQMRRATDDALNAYNKKQPGDPVKGVSLVLDCISGTGKAEGKRVPWHICLGSDAYEAITGAIDPFRTEMDEWKAITDTTDF
jgi:hypothetical protein